MAGFDNDTMYANNVDFSGGSPVTGKVTADGELLIGSTASPNIKVGNLNQPAAGLTVSYNDPDLDLALADDLAALEGLSGTGMVARTASNTYALRTLTEGSGITITNGDGVAGNPTISSDAVGASASTVFQFEDFLGGTKDQTLTTTEGYPLWGWVFSGTINLNRDTYAEAGHPGIYTVSTSAGSDASLWAGDSGVSSGCATVGGGTLTFEWLIKLSDLSDATNDYTAIVGLNGSSSASIANGIYFSYNHAVNSGNWVANTESGGAVTSSNSSTAATTDWVKLTAVVNAAGTSVSYFVDGVAVSGGAIATNIPSSQIGPVIVIDRNAGTSVRYIKADYFSLKYELTTPR